MKNYFEDLYNMDTQGQVTVHMDDFGGVQRGDYFGGKLVKRTELERRVRGSFEKGCIYG